MFMFGNHHVVLRILRTHSSDVSSSKRPSTFQQSLIPTQLRASARLTADLDAFQWQKIVRRSTPCPRPFSRHEENNRWSGCIPSNVAFEHLSEANPRAWLAVSKNTQRFGGSGRWSAHPNTFFCAVKCLTCRNPCSKQMDRASPVIICTALLVKPHTSTQRRSTTTLQNRALPSKPCPCNARKISVVLLLSAVII